MSNECGAEHPKHPEVSCEKADFHQGLHHSYTEQMSWEREKQMADEGDGVWINRG